MSAMEIKLTYSTSLSRVIIHTLQNIISIMGFIQRLCSLLVRLFSMLLRASGWLLNCRRRARVPRPLSDFDVDANTGFMPRRPLPKLRGEFELWESALRSAAETIVLGSDESEEAAQKRASGSAWRKAIEQVSLALVRRRHMQLLTFF